MQKTTLRSDGVLESLAKYALDHVLTRILKAFPPVGTDFPLFWLLAPTMPR
jgi:hypothetical protein